MNRTAGLCLALVVGTAFGATAVSRLQAQGKAPGAYAIVDMDRQVVTLYRVAYPIETAQKKILDAGLPPMLAYRLGMGR